MWARSLIIFITTINLYSCVILDELASELALLTNRNDYEASNIYGYKPLSVSERNALLEAMTNYEWLSTDKYGITYAYLFRIDDNGVVVSYTRADMEQKNPENYLKETARGYKLDFPKQSAFLEFWLTEQGVFALLIKVGTDKPDLYEMTPRTRKDAYDDNIF